MKQETLSRSEKRWLFWMEFCAKYAGCHQLPERSFFIKGYQFPICARCTGILIGYIVALIVNPFIVMPLWIPALMVPMAIDGTVQLLTRYESNQFLRVTTGLLFGYAAISTLFTYTRLIIDFCIRRWG